MKATTGLSLHHNSVTYNVAFHSDAGDAVLLISYKRRNLFYEHYLGVASKKDAGWYFGIELWS